MTKKNGFKKSVRKRMAVTGESYLVAAGKVQEGAAVPELTVFWLGEDSEYWFVEGTLDVTLARKLATAEWESTMTDPGDEEWRVETSAGIASGSAVARSDWFWRPSGAGDGYGDFMLECLEKKPELYDGKGLTVGVWLSVFPEMLDGEVSFL